jgi:K+-transporting ATPase ATPase C chain
MNMRALVRSALAFFFMFIAVTGILYPLAVTGLAQALFPGQANGSLVERDGQILGSRLIGQPFDDPRYFWGRPSATSPFPYNAASSSGSNLGPANPALMERIRARIAALKAADPGNNLPIPIDLVTASASGLDPHISVAGALYQVPRIARARGLPEDEVRALVQTYTEDRWFGILGEPRLNVLLLNLALDGIK